MQKYNVLIIMSDQHNRRYLGCAGNPLVQTPNMDRLARDGIRFESAYCASPLCGPSRMSFLTGLYPCNTGVYANAQALASDMPTFAHAFGAAGYDTALIGRMHIVGPDQHHGFEERIGGDVTASTLGGGMFPLTEGLPCGGQPEGLWLSGPGDSSYQHYDDKITALAVDWLERRAPRRPFMATVGFALPHNPYVCSAADYELYENRIEPPPVNLENLHPHLREKHERETADMGELEIRRSLAAYAGSVTATDRRIGCILDALQRSGLAERTLVIYTSDHGDAAGEQGLWHKSSMLEGSARVPLIIRLPEGESGGTVCRQHVNLLDLAPTLLDLVGADPLPDIDGRSLRPLLAGITRDWDNATFSEYGTRWAYSALMRMLRRDRWKFIYYDAERPSLFDLVNDPEEDIDLAESPAHVRILAQLQDEILDGWDPAEVNHRIDLWKRRNAVIYGWFASRPRDDNEIFRAPAGSNRLDSVPDWDPAIPAEWPANVASF